MIFTIILQNTCKKIKYHKNNKNVKQSKENNIKHH